MTEKNGLASRAIWMAMRIRRYGVESITQYGRSWATLDATGRLNQARIRPYRSSECHGHRFQRKNRVVALWNSLSEASVQKAQNGPSTQLIEATSCVERWNTTIKAAEHS